MSARELSSNAQLALAWAAAGHPVMRMHRIRPDGICSCGDIACVSPGKHPWDEPPLTDLDAIKQKWRNRPLSGVGIVDSRTGAVRIVTAPPGDEEAPSRAPGTTPKRTGSESRADEAPAAGIPAESANGLSYGDPFRPWDLFNMAPIPIAVLRSTEIEAGAKCLIARLLASLGKNPFCFPGEETLAKEMGIPIGTLRRWWKQVNPFFKRVHKGPKSPRRIFALWNPLFKESLKENYRDVGLVDRRVDPHYGDSRTRRCKKVPSDLSSVRGQLGSDLSSVRGQLGSDLSRKGVQSSHKRGSVLSNLGVAYKEEEVQEEVQEEVHPAVEGFAVPLSDHNTSLSSSSTTTRCDLLSEKIKAAVERFFFKNSISKPRGPLPASDIARVLGKHKTGPKDLIDFLPIYRDRLKNLREGPVSWAHLVKALENHLQGSRIQPAMAIQSAASEWSERLYKRHPRKKNKALFEQRLAQILAKSENPAELFKKINDAHVAWCTSAAWMREGGRYVPSLDTWLIDEGWTVLPAPEEDGNFCYPRLG